MGCDVCIGGDYDYDGANEFEHVETPKARRPHQCIECRKVIAKGEKYERFSWKFDSQVGTTKTCLLCAEIRNAFSCGEDLLASELWELMEELAFPRLTTASECFRDLSAAAKAVVMERWRKWKGLAA